MHVLWKPIHRQSDQYQPDGVVEVILHTDLEGGEDVGGQYGFQAM